MWKLVVLILVSIVGCFVGCDSSGHDLYFVCAELPTEISLAVNKTTGLEPKSIIGEKGRRSYAIHLDKNGAPVVKSDWVVTQYHRTFITLPGGAMREGNGFEWKSLPTRIQTVRSHRKDEVIFKSTGEGPIFRIAIWKTDDAK